MKSTPTPTIRSADPTPRKPRCLSCRREIAWEGNPHRPFCSVTCRLIDLGAWLDEGYRIPAVEESPSEKASAES